MNVVIEGVEYVPRSTVISDRACVLLSQALRISLGNVAGHLTCDMPGCVENMRDLYELLDAANQEIGFHK